jgi:hypothetical protein
MIAYGSTFMLTAIAANFSVVDLYGMMRTKGFAEGLTQGLLDRSCMYGVRGSIPTQPAVRALYLKSLNPNFRAR